MPVSLIRKKWVPWALSGLPAVRPAMLRFGLAMIGLPLRGSAKGRSGMVRPVHPVREMRTASSSSVSGARASVEDQLIEPASTELPRLTRWVRRRQIDVISGRFMRVWSPVWRSVFFRSVMLLSLPGGSRAGRRSVAQTCFEGLDETGDDAVG